MMLQGGDCRRVGIKLTCFLPTTMVDVKHHRAFSDFTLRHRAGEIPNLRKHDFLSMAIDKSEPAHFTFC